MAISLEKMKTLPGCENALPIHNACIVGPGNVHMALESLNTNQEIPISSDVRLLTMSLSPTRIRVVSDSSGLPITTIGGNEFAPELGQYYEVRLEKIG
jgi:hypothetical protein